MTPVSEAVQALDRLLHAIADASGYQGARDGDAVALVEHVRSQRIALEATVASWENGLARAEDQRDNAVQEAVEHRREHAALWLNMQTALHDPSPTSPDDMIEKVTRLVRRLRTLEEAPAGARLRWTADGSPYFENQSETPQ